MKGERVKLVGSVLATGSGAAGEALDDEFTIACGQGAVRLTKLQRAGKGPMEAGVFARGFPLLKGEKLG
jgi:methionyl-tRNA formyltransferase